MIIKMIGRNDILISLEETQNSDQIYLACLLTILLALFYHVLSTLINMSLLNLELKICRF